MGDETDASPSAPATLAADRDGGGGQQRSEEDELLRRISEQRKLINGLPGKTRADVCGRAPHQKKLGQLEFQYHMLMERKRVSAVLAEHQEKHGALYSEPCLVCLDDIYVYASAGLVKRLFCCGGFVCATCAQNPRPARCPLCRKSESYGGKKKATELMSLAERGVMWAQTQVGRCMIEGIQGIKKQKNAGLKWIKKAAAQNEPSALHYLAELYRDGFASVLDESQEKSKELLMRSANLGHVAANSQLARFYLHLAEFYSAGSAGLERDPDEAIFRATVAHALDASNESAAMILGFHLKPDQASELSPYLACYYLNIAANEDEDGIAS